MTDRYVVPEEIHAELPEESRRTPDAPLGTELADDYEGEPLRGDDNLPLEAIPEDEDDPENPTIDTPFPDDFETYGQDARGDE